MNPRIALIVIVTLLAAGAALLLFVPDTTVEDGVVFTGTADLSEENAPPDDQVQTTTPGITDVIAVGTPTDGYQITSPLTVTGSARGTWYSEGTFPIEVRNTVGIVVGTGVAQAQSEWATEDFVVFHGVVTFPAQSAGSAGQVVVKKANPSGDPKQNQQVVIPITFK